MPIEDMYQKKITRWYRRYVLFNTLGARCRILLRPEHLAGPSSDDSLGHGRGRYSNDRRASARKEALPGVESTPGCTF